MKEKNTQNRIKEAAEASVIISLLARFAAFLYSAAKNSFIGGVLTSADSVDKKAEESTVFSKAASFFGFNGGAVGFKHRFAKQVDNSRIISFFYGIFRGLADIKLPVLGTYFLSLGLYTLFIGFIRLFFEEAFLLAYFLLPIIFVFMGGAFSRSRKRVGEALAESLVYSAVFVSLFGFKKDSLINKKETSGGRKRYAFIFGMLTGMLTYLVSPLYVLLGVAAIFACYFVMCSPEAGLALLLFLTPFFVFLPRTSILLGGALLFVAFSYAIKLFRGKRIAYFTSIDLFVIFFGLFTLMGAFGTYSGASSQSVLMYLILLLGYFLCSQLFTSRFWLTRGVAFFALGGCVSGLYGIFQYVTGNTASTWQDEEMFSDIAGRAVSFYENPNMFGEVMMMVLPLALALFLLSKTKLARLSSVVNFAAAALGLILSFSRGAWVGVIFAMAVFLLMWNKKSLTILLFSLLLIPFLPLILPESIVMRFLSIGNMGDSSTSYRVYIWRAAIDMIKDFFLFGIGAGEVNFKAVYPQYAYSGIERVPHTHNLYFQVFLEGGVFAFISLMAMLTVFVSVVVSFISKEKNGFPRLVAAAGLAGIFGALLQGATDYIWYNYRVYFLFFALMGISVAAIRAGKKDNKEMSTPQSVNSADMYLN